MNQPTTESRIHRELVRYSKFLSLILRHNPAAIGIELDKSGWVDVAVLLKAINQKYPDLTFETLVQIVETNEKQRFAFSADRTRIRASQGHSIGVDLNVPPSIPPNVLFHGTATKNIASIQTLGLIRGKRDYVHLSASQETAKTVGARHGKPAILEIDTTSMLETGHLFYISANGVWLTTDVPPKFIRFPNE